MKATGIVRRVDDLGRIVIPKEIRRTLKIREGDPLLATLTPIDRFCLAIHSLAQRITAQQRFYCDVMNISYIKKECLVIAIVVFMKKSIDQCGKTPKNKATHKKQYTAYSPNQITESGEVKSRYNRRDA